MKKYHHMVEGSSIYKYSIDYNIVERANHPLTVPEEYVHTLVPPGMPPHCLHLTLRAVYILLHNMCVADGLCIVESAMAYDSHSPR